MKLLSDARLAMFARIPVPIIRRRVARRAAARALHATALAAAGDDAAVLASLGLFAAAEGGTGSDRAAARGRALARAARTGIAPDGAARWPLVWRRRLGAAIAPADPEAAAALLHDAPLARAACALAAGLPVSIPDDARPEALLLRAACAKPDERGTDINKLFQHFGLAPPLATDDARLEAYAGTPLTSVSEGPLVSAIVPLHQGAATIAAAVRSLLRQSWRTIEVLVVDDRSTDGGPAIVRALAEEDSRVRLLTSAGPAGASAARNTGIAAAAGRFIAFLDADDWAHPERIARQVERIGSGAFACVSAHYRVDQAGRPVAPRVFPLLRLCPISMVVRRDALLAAGPFEIAQTGADAELLGRMDTLWGRGRVPRDPAPLTVASWRAASLSNDRDNPLSAIERTRYREDWMRRHVALLGRGLPKLEPGS